MRTARPSRFLFLILWACIESPQFSADTSVWKPSYGLHGHRLGFFTNHSVLLVLCLAANHPMISILPTRMDKGLAPDGGLLVWQVVCADGWLIGMAPPYCSRAVILFQSVSKYDLPLQVVEQNMVTCNGFTVMACSGTEADLLRTLQYTSWFSVWLYLKFNYSSGLFEWEERGIRWWGSRKFGAPHGALVVYEHVFCHGCIKYAYTGVSIFESYLSLEITFRCKFVSH